MSSSEQFVVVVHPMDGSNGHDSYAEDGYQEISGRVRVQTRVDRQVGAVRDAAQAIAGGVGIVARELAQAIDAGVGENATMGLETVEVSFGITLTGGVQAMFTSQVESSAQVTITLSRRAAHGA
jgi:hypothetical protein